MNDCPTREVWASLVTSPLDEPLPDELERHLAGCASCQELMLQLTGAPEEEWAYWRQLCQLPKRKPKKRTH
jgi:hypothetical protein